MKKNNKQMLADDGNSIKKSNEFALSTLNKGLSLNQKQLLAYAIYCTQKNGITEFHKADFEKKFDLERFTSAESRHDSEKLYDLKVSVIDPENESWEFNHVFDNMNYKKGLFIFKWKPFIIPHILNLQERYITEDLTITSKFKSGFSWTLYEHLKAHYGYWYLHISKDDLLRMFNVQDVKTYQRDTSVFKKGVLEKAIGELNEHTEFEVQYKEYKEGRSIVAFDIIWSVGGTVEKATKKQLEDIRRIIDTIFEDAFKYINLSITERRENAIRLIQQLEAVRDSLELTAGMTKDYAASLKKQATDSLKTLEMYCEQEKQERRAGTQQPVEFYNWLELDEELKKGE